MSIRFVGENDIDMLSMHTDSTSLLENSIQIYIVAGFSHVHLCFHIKEGTSALNPVLTR